MNVDVVTPLEMLKRVEFMFPQKPGIAEEAQRTADLEQVAKALKKYLLFKNILLTDIERALRDNHCISFIKAPPL